MTQLLPPSRRPEKPQRELQSLSGPSLRNLKHQFFICQDCLELYQVQGADPPLRSYSSCVVLESKIRKTVAMKVILLKSEYFPVF